jgi:hypothetical protein
MHDEIIEGKIEHKLACACERVGLLEHFYPPIVWTNGAYPNGIPEGALIQLDPELFKLYHDKTGLPENIRFK